MKILVSACLVGCDCRYQGDHRASEAVMALAKAHTLIPVCPEQLGGLPTPRDPSEIVGDRVMMKSGADVTAQYRKGAETAGKIAELTGADLAILKAGSPSCGKGQIYDGSFTGKKIPGNGISAALLLAQGLPVFSEEQMDEVAAWIAEKTGE